jgi:choline dehydrogenase-like flavoprotein
VPEDLLDANQFPSSHDWGYQSEPGVLGRSIPVPIRRYTDRLSLLHRSFVRTATASGFRRIEDMNGPDQIGVGVLARNVVDGVRQNASITYLERVRQRTNLVI